MAIPPVVMIVPLVRALHPAVADQHFPGRDRHLCRPDNALFGYLLTSFFRSLPKELFEAARIDGAGDLLILLKIVIPLSLAGLVDPGGGQRPLCAGTTC